MSFDRADIYIIGTTVIVMYAAGAWKNKLPSTGAIHDMVAMIDTKGGNILLLGSLALYFFHRTEQMYYAMMSLVNSGTITADNGVALNGLLFCNGAFSGVSGALLKVMSGSEPAQSGKTTVTTSSSLTLPTPPLEPIIPPTPSTSTTPPTIGGV